MIGLEVRTLLEQVVERQRIILRQVCINQGAPGPERRAEPGIQRVRVLFPLVPAFAVVGRRPDSDVSLFPAIGVGAVPDGNTMPPPDLSADAPVAQVVDPVEVNLLETLGDDPDIAVPDHGLQDFFQAALLAFPVDNRLVDVDEPLQADLRLDNTFAALIDSDVMEVVLVRFDDQAFLSQLGDDLGTGFGNRLAGELTTYRQ